MNLKKKRSFLDRLTGRGSYEEDDFEEYEVEEEIIEEIPRDRNVGIIRNSPLSQIAQQDNRSTWMEEQGDEGELSLDMYQTAAAVVVKTMIPGVKKEDLDIALSRDTLTIKGKRVEDGRIADQDYFHRELYWGAFSRKVDLPHEVDIEQAEAIEKDGMLTLILPRVDKGKQTKLKIKSL